MRTTRDEYPEDPILALTREWKNDVRRLRREGSTKLGVIVALVLALIAAVGAYVYEVTWHRTPPYVMEVDRLGNVAYGGELNGDIELTDKHVSTQLVLFAERWRTVTPDNTMQKKNINDLYCMVPRGVPAHEGLNSYFAQEKNNPFELNEDVLVSPAIKSILLLTGNTWQVNWTEQVRGLDGTPQGQPLEFRASLIVERGQLPDNDCRLGNPVGISVSQLQWTRVQ